MVAATDNSAANLQVAEAQTEFSEEGFLDRERVRLLYKNNGVVLAATAVLAILICLTLASIVPHQILAWWLLAYMLVTCIRIATLYQYRAHLDNYSTTVWHRLFMLGAGLAGLTWGIAAVIFFVPDQPSFMLLLTCLYAVVVSVGTQALSLSLPSFLLFSLLMILPLMARLILEEGDFYRPLGLIGFLYLFAICAFAYNNNRAAIESIRIRFENIDLVRQLSEQKAKAEDSQKFAEQANLGKSRFLAAASHDLRQPLHALMLFQNALEPYVSDGGDRIMQRMNQSIAALGGLFDGLLDISKLDAGVVEVNPKNFRIATLCQGLCSEYRAEAQEKGVTMITEVNDEVAFVDPIMLERILRNLISNAIRYTASGQIVISSRMAEETIIVSVKDTGCGIPQADLEKVFSEYHQLSNPTRDRTKGLGLGLAIVRRLCKLLGVEMKLESKVGDGSTFSLSLPVGDPGTAATQTHSHAWDLSNAKILVIDDERDILESMKDVLRRWGCETITASTIDEALASVDKMSTPPTAIVADYRLADGENGIMAIVRVREYLQREIPALLVSGDTAPERLLEVKASGLRLLHKPVSPTILRTALYQELISHRS